MEEDNRNKNPKPPQVPLLGLIPVSIPESPLLAVYPSGFFFFFFGIYLYVCVYASMCFGWSSQVLNPHSPAFQNFPVSQVFRMVALSLRHAVEGLSVLPLSRTGIK